MKKQIIVLLALVTLAFSASAQKYFTRDGKVKFDATSAGSPEQIEALTKTASCVLDVSTGNMQWAVLLKSFRFEKSLMEEHFNENYVESNKYPKATFSGKITNLSEIDFTKDGTYNAVVSGTMNLHGITQNVSTNGAITISGGKVRINAGFDLPFSDYGINIPSLVNDKVAKQAKILIDASLDMMK